MRLLLLVFALVASHAFAADTARLVTDLMTDERELASVPFAEVVQAATGKQVLAMNPTNHIEREVLAKLGRAMDAVLRQLNATNSPARQKRRINEVSALFENAMQAELNAVEGFECDFPKLASCDFRRCSQFSRSVARDGGRA